MSYDGLVLRKGRVLGRDDLDALDQRGVETVTVAMLEVGDMHEDEAAALLAAALVPNGTTHHILVEAPFTGRVNLFAKAQGVLDLDARAVDVLNAIDPAITLATLPAMTRVAEGDMLATLKIIPYGLSAALVEQACATLAGDVLRIHRPVLERAALILTRTPGMRETLIDKGEAAVVGRLAALGVTVNPVRVVPHETKAVANALDTLDAPLTLILGGAATSDPQDVGPAAVRMAGGTITRFGMPVDPGNLLFLGEHRARPVIGLPGCARSPALNGADWVLERVICGVPVQDADISGMGVGGLLKEIPTRPQPRAFTLRPKTEVPKVSVLLLAAGQSRRMGGEDKLTKAIGGVPLLRRQAQRATESLAQEVLVVLPPNAAARAATLDGLPVRQVTANRAAEGMSASLRAGLAEISPQTDAVLVMLADMPDVETALIDRLITGYRPGEQADILRPVTPQGKPGHPVLFGQRFFGMLAELSGDQGARDVLRAAQEFVRDVPVSDDGPLIDLDTQEAWAAYLAKADR
ncbi:MAG: molybdopterin-binding/glycosyltransferase family 2 protein [Pseudomonadota bacterium]